jgi:hypothetical protein
MIAMRKIISIVKIVCLFTGMDPKLEISFIISWEN